MFLRGWFRWGPFLPSAAGTVTVGGWITLAGTYRRA